MWMWMWEGGWWSWWWLGGWCGFAWRLDGVDARRFEVHARIRVRRRRRGRIVGGLAIVDAKLLRGVGWCGGRSCFFDLVGGRLRLGGLGS